MPPLTETAIVEHLEFICDDKGNDVISQTLLEHQQATYTAVAILERMYLLESDMEIKDVFKVMPFVCMIILKQCSPIPKPVLTV